MPAVCLRDPWSTRVFDPQRLLVQAYTRLILLPARADGSKMAVIAQFGTREICLIETLAADAPPESVALRVELYDRARGHAVESMACNDLEEAPFTSIDEIERLPSMTPERAALLRGALNIYNPGGGLEPRSQPEPAQR